MAWIQRLLWPQPAPPTLHESDIIYPTHFLDDLPGARDLIMTWTMRFNDVLDPDMLHTSLAKLLEVGDWRKLGGRLRRQDGKLQLHVPNPFTKERPALFYTHEAFGINIDEHPLGKQMPKATTNPSLQPNVELFRPFSARPDSPVNVEEYFTQDLPQLSLHVVSFTDATLVSIVWPHILLDAMGLRDLVIAWSLVLNGREAEIPPVLGVRDDLAYKVADPSKGGEAFNLTSRRLGGLAFFGFVFNLLWDVFFGAPMEPRVIFLPKKTVDRLQQRVKDDLGTLEVKAGDGGMRPHISKGDVLVAWMVRMLASSLPKPRPITSMSAVDLRSRVSGLCEPEALYIQNMMIATSMPLTSSEASAASLGEIALRHRQSLIHGATSAQLTSVLQIMRQDKDAGRDPTILVGESNTLLTTFSNWTKAKFSKIVDFSKAVVQTGDGSPDRINPPGTMIYHYPALMKRFAHFRNLVNIMGTDHEDNYWMYAYMSARTWSKIEQSMRELSS
ncbi:O-acetyltransferase PaAT-2 [Cladobotryum mycophilum]|uniref:O-acetyltransferase PaAT-2 n=1 Tax=Cladobotryum mycophilum TaxID=491253 RepID=A0ABR0SP60_9HYPO